jgi:hypothetical protein
MMSASRFKTTGGSRTKLYTQVVYRCLAGRTNSRHGRLNISESKLIEWVKAEAARFRIPAAQVEIGERDDARRLELEARRRRVIDNYEDAIIDKAERDAKLLRIGDELARLEAVETVIDIPQAIDWSWDAKAINEVLRALWDYVRLDADMRPTEAIWRVPEWRA